MITGKNIVLGVSGGIAAYKACELTSRLKKQGAEIDVIMTEAATKFVAPLTFQSLSLNKVTVNMFDEPKYWEIGHIALAKKADVFVIAPASANIIGKIANGIADDMLTTTVMATKAPVVIVPAMNTNMYENVIVQKNIETLKNLGYHFIEPGEGRLACGDVGKGKMAEPEEIEKYIENLLNSNNDMAGITVLVTAGPTRESLDPVRFITNRSTGKMGFAIAQAAAERGANVILVSGPTNIATPKNVKRIDIESAAEMYNKVIENFYEADIIIKSAAVADYAPLDVSEQKIKKSGDSLTIQLKKNKDILFELGKIKGEKILIGFAMETEALVDNAKEKVKKKNLDFIVANDLKTEGAGFGTDTNVVKIIDSEGKIENIDIMQKSKLADVILDKAMELNKKKRT